jgi:uncharacterized protein YdaL
VLPDLPPVLPSISPLFNLVEQVQDVLNPFPADTRPGPVPAVPDDRPPTPPLPDIAPSGPSTLVLYDDAGPYGWLGELYAIAAGHLASRFGTWEGRPVAGYQAGDLAHFSAVVYVGSTYDQPLPAAFLDDVLAGKRPVIWIYDNIWQLSNRAASTGAATGFTPWYFDTSTVSRVLYKGTALTRYPSNLSGIMVHSAIDGARTSVLASAVRADGSTFPWAVRSGALTYVGEIPFAYIDEKDRYLAFADLLFDAHAPQTPERHRALVRIEDVSPAEDPASIRAIADYLWSEGVPFSISVIPFYKDPLGANSGGAREAYGLSDAPAMVSALKYAVGKGATLVLHGYTHQYRDVANPYNGVTGDDFEFWRAHIDPQNNVVLDGPVAEDSAVWAAGRVADGLAAMALVGLLPPQIWNYPHYAGSGVDSRAIASLIPMAYHRGLYFKGALTGLPDDTTRFLGQFFPYPVTDVYGWKMIPEDAANYEPEAYNNHPARLAADVVANAQAQLVVRDGVASFYFHPFYPLAALQEIVTGIKQAGYTFVGPFDL